MASCASEKLEIRSGRVENLPSALVALAALMVLLGTIYFGSLRPGYSHIANTISELGETGAPRARMVAFGFFLPVGLLVWAALYLVWCRDRKEELLPALTAMSCLATGYVVAAFFPCDPGAPFFGSWRTQVHNIAGFIDYEGTGLGFLLAVRWVGKHGEMMQARAFLAAGLLVLVCAALLASEWAFGVRGAIQRVAEVIDFAGGFVACREETGRVLMQRRGEAKRWFFAVRPRDG